MQLHTAVVDIASHKVAEDTSRTEQARTGMGPQLLGKILALEHQPHRMQQGTSSGLAVEEHQAQLPFVDEEPEPLQSQEKGENQDEQELVEEALRKERKLHSTALTLPH